MTKMLLLRAFTELQVAAQKVLDEMDRNLDTKDSPQKYGAPFGALVELRQLLARTYGLR
jgi:hypothetical protein